MDYEKKYKEALERLRNAFYNNNSRICEEYRNAALKIIEPIFPELAESEDERIRKAIGYAIGQSTHSDGTLINGVSSEEALSWLEKQGEQKQVEWSEEDKKHIEYIEYLLNQEKYNHPQYQPNIDERIAWLKSLRPQKQQYDDEWSDEDKEFLKLTLSNLTELKDRYGEGYGRVGGCIDWLKSLRPQNTWKPSEEQIKAVKEAACYSSVFSEKTIDNLISLSKQLKKLMVE